MNMNRLPDYLAHMQQAAADACGFVSLACDPSNGRVSWP